MATTGEGDRDWEAVERSDGFVDLERTRKRIVVPGLAVFVVWFGSFLICAAYARGFMAKDIYRGFTVAYAVAFSIVVMTWLIAFVYIRSARSSVDPQIDRLDLDR
jgi:uncharacterized membrane protein (DUF485 family)